MKVSRKTVLNVLLIIFVLSFFVTPIGEYSKEMLNEVFATTPTVISPENRGKISDYNWRLKNAEWDFFSFEEASGEVVFINFWASWHLPSRAQLKGIQKLYDRYKGKVRFYIITDQERELPEELMSRKGYTFPLTYLVVGDPSPIEILEPPGTYILDKNGFIAVHQTAISDWNNDTVYSLLDQLIAGD
ncbi:TlpA family protein disulfide reductase [Muriicola sp. Z0-33]|uniref:TlpA family protein disulfide reductase n=1 Tax=Muriicola sp. Z0-33 TaxID=2816957 RepID=UPI002238F9EE|nr:TlpA disulfide reductase family protein [Muriicola sp. Z0-33]MCW5517347.1 TlpA family protein disulfide reductase [Muriicola sp. Z0-33]